jgi:hypothetical protein
MSDATPFSSECPKCGHDRVQTGYTREELRQLLQSGAEIEAYCMSCDENWPISVEERADLSRAVAKRSWSEWLSMVTLSLRRLWTIYKRTAIAQGFGSGRRDLALAHIAFYSGARGVLRVLGHMLEHGESDAALRTIRRFGRQIHKIQARHPRARRHWVKTLPSPILKKHYRIPRVDLVPEAKPGIA